MAYSKTQFFSSEFFKNNTIVDVNCDAKIINKAIIEAQDIYLEQYLGTALYRKIISDLNGSGLSGNYLTLRDSYIIDVLLHWTMYLLAPNQVWKWRNRSIDTESGENSTASAKDDVVFLQSQCKNKAEAYAKKLTDYLCANQNLFPELQQNNTSDMKNPNHTSYTLPMYLGEDEDYKDRYYS